MNVNFENTSRRAGKITQAAHRVKKKRSAETQNKTTNGKFVLWTFRLGNSIFYRSDSRYLFLYVGVNAFHVHFNYLICKILEARIRLRGLNFLTTHTASLSKDFGCGKKRLHPTGRPLGRDIAFATMNH